MISLQVNQLSKRFTKNWIIKDFNYLFYPGTKTGVSGPNGSGKSTILRMLAGFLASSEGEIVYTDKSNNRITEDNWYKYFSFFGPYIQLNEELNPLELYDFVSVIKPLKIDNRDDFIDLIDLKAHRNKEISSFSSGMKQRLALGFIMLSKAPLLFLDEPSSFLDKTAKEWLSNMLRSHCQEKTIIIASNDQSDFNICENFIEI